MANRKRKCACCKTYGEAADGIKTIAGWFIDAGHVLTYARNKQQRASSKARKERVRNFRLNDVAHQRKLTQTVANQLAMLLDRGKPCISSGVPDDGKPRRRNASHFKSRGSNSFLRYSMLNLHAATAHDNNFKSGNIEGYRKGLLERYGQWIIDYLDNAPRSKVWTSQELTELRGLYAEEVRRLTKGLPPSKDWRSLPIEERA
jgi:hypothetical protein